jgi:hypothetical protein
VRIGGKALSAPAEGWPGKRLPDSVLGYSPFDVVVLQDLGDADLEPAQVEALRAWVHLGGFVVFAPQSLGGEVFRSRIAGEFFGDALEEEPKQVPGFKPGELFASGKGDLQDFRGRDPLLKPAKEVPLALLDPFRGNGAREVVALPHGSPAEGEEASRLYAEIPYGRGTVGLMTAHPPSGATLEEGTAILEVLAGVWKQVIEWHAGDASDHPARATANFQASDLEGLLHDASRDVGLPFITAVIGAYLLLVGPGLYFLLRRWNRLPAVVWVEPLLVVVYLGVIFATGYITKGVLTKTKLLTFISHAEGSPVALRSSYLTIFSAGEETYRIDCPRGALVNPVFFNEKEARPVVLSRSGKGGLSLEDYRLGHWEQGHVANWEVLDLAGSGLEIEALPSPPDAPRVKVTNRLAYPVLEGAVFRSRMEIPLQRIEPGQTVTAGAGESPAGGADARGAAAKNAGRSDEDLRPLRRAMLWYKRGRGRDLLAMALVDRGEADFQVDKRTSLKERFDVYFLHGER